MYNNLLRCVVANGDSAFRVAPTAGMANSKDIVEERVVTTETPFTYKVDLFMRSHILPCFDPGKIRWWLSLSGGKDSFSMAEGLRDWYTQRRIRFDSVLFTINQWQGDAHLAIKEQIRWGDVQVIDANALTAQSTGYQTGQQAPCRLCADVRRDVTDKLIREDSDLPVGDPPLVNMIARGLHLTDTSISALWRHAMGRPAAQSILTAGKARRIAHLYGNVYLAKPLYYVREFESEQYARMAGYRRSCCGCPACQYPSRRDIVEESIAGFLRSPLWEFEVPGIRELLLKSDPVDSIDKIKRRSQPGTEVKHPHLPRAFAIATAEKYLKCWNSVRTHLAPLLAADSDLDVRGINWLRNRDRCEGSGNLPMPSILRNHSVGDYSDFHLMTIATLGPFWGAIGLESGAASRAWDIQREYFGIYIDERWSQTQELLREYYRERPAERTPNANLVQIGPPISS